MYKVIIADDNPIICQALVSRIPWTELDLELSGICNNGEEVLELIQNFEPDIVITDIRMPLKDGIEMMEQLRSKRLAVQIIVISGYNEFQYVKKAIDFDVVGYLTKPIQDNELIDNLNKAINNLSKLNRFSQISHSIQQLEKRETIRKANLNLKAYLKNPKNLYEVTGKLIDFPFPDAHQWWLFQLPMDEEYKFQEFDIESVAALEEDLNGSLHVRIHTFVPTRTMLALVCPLLPRDIAEELPHRMAKYLKMDQTEIKYVASKTCISHEQLNKEFIFSINQLYQMIFGCQFSMKSDITINSIYRELQPLRTSLSLSNCKGAAQQLSDQLNQFVNNIPSYNELDLFIKYIVHLYAEYSPHFHEISDQLDSTLLPSLSFASKDHLLELFRGKMFRAETATSDKNKTEKIVRFIEDNFTQPLTVAGLSSIFHHNAIYLGQLIKRETGMPFNQFLNKLRIEHALVIMERNKEIKLNELAKLLGFEDSTYFSKVFKKITGRSPSNY